MKRTAALVTLTLLLLVGILLPARTDTRSASPETLYRERRELQAKVAAADAAVKDLEYQRDRARKAIANYEYVRDRNAKVIEKLEKWAEAK